MFMGCLTYQLVYVLSIKSLCAFHLATRSSLIEPFCYANVYDFTVYT